MNTDYFKLMNNYNAAEPTESSLINRHEENLLPKNDLSR